MGAQLKEREEREENRGESRAGGLSSLGSLPELKRRGKGSPGPAGNEQLDQKNPNFAARRERVVGLCLQGLDERDSFACHELPHLLERTPCQAVQLTRVKSL